MKLEPGILDARAFGLAAGTVAAVLTTFCAAALVVAPETTTAVASTLTHLDLSGMSRTLTWSGYFTGLIGWTIGAGLVFWGGGALYNRFARERTVAMPAEHTLATR